MILLIVLFLSLKYNKILFVNYIELNRDILKMNINMTFNNKLINKIKIGTFTYYLENGGRSRITTFLFNYLYKINIFNLYLFTIKIKDHNEYFIENKINRILINDSKKNRLIKLIIKKRLNIFIYQLSYSKEINALNKLKNIKIIVYQHQSFFYWIYSNYSIFKSLYNSYKKSKYIISLIHFENDYIFKKWGIKSILMNNFITYEYNSSIPMDLSSKTILMIGRANDRFKRFDLGIQAMEYIANKIPGVEMKIMTNNTRTEYLNNIIYCLNLEKYIHFFDYSPMPEKNFRNVSLNIITSISESFSLVLSETKVFGIPNILIGLDYLSTANGGSIIIYDDSPECIAKESIKILINDYYRKKIGNEARKSMKKFDNKILLKKWIKLILSIYYNNEYYEKFNKKITENKAINQLKTQILFLKKRKNILKDITINNIDNFTILENINLSQ